MADSFLEEQRKAREFFSTGEFSNVEDRRDSDEKRIRLSNDEAFADIDLSEEIESDHLYAEEHKDINDYFNKKSKLARLEKEKKEQTGDIKSKKLGNKITKPTPPGILRYPFEGMTQHTDYLQIDILEYKPVGRKQKTQEPSADSLKWAKEKPDEAKKEFPKGVGTTVVKEARFTGKMGGRRNSLNNKVGRTRSYALSTRPLKNEGTILLPIPSNVQDGNSVKVGDSSLNGLQAAGASGVMSAMTTDISGAQTMRDAAGKIATGLADAAKNFSNQTKAGATLDDIKSVALNKLTAGALGIFGGNVTTNQLLARQEGTIINPNMELLFDGPTLRAFKFQFKMTPRNRKEAEQIRLIIRAFKRNMAPKAKGGTEKENGWFLKTPNVFELRYRTGNRDHKYLHKFKQCFLTDISVNYTGDGVYSTYEDGSPVSYLMDLSFKELEPIYDIDYDAIKDHDSVGY
tara:strand:- start:252 stop:1628 length:1377 start_codon:yes stop_codon:yes gene_type:complete